MKRSIDSIGKPRHYHHIRRSRSRRVSEAPRYATHYQCADDVVSPVFGPTPDFLALLAEPDNALPVTFLPTTHMLIVDTGASVTITPEIRDFVKPPRDVQPTVLQGIASGLEVRGIGEVQYSLHTKDGSAVPIRLSNALYVPGCAARLLCPRHVAEVTGIQGDGFFAFRDHAYLRCHGQDIPATYHASTGLPFVLSTGFPLQRIYPVIQPVQLQLSCLPRTRHLKRVLAFPICPNRRD